MKIIDAAPKDEEEDEEEEGGSEREYVQWDINGSISRPMPKLNLQKKLVPGYYKPRANQEGIWLSKLNVRLDGLVDFGSGVSAEVVEQISRFWAKEEKFREINKNIKVLYKRGILLYGPPGCGKSSMLSIVIRDIVAQGGVALVYQGTEITAMLVKIIREIQPDMKILVIIEDLDGIVRGGEEDVLNMLDGVDTSLDSVIFLATTNHMDRLSRRLLRPSRFDFKIEMSYPNATLRKRYFNDLLQAYNGKTKINLAQTVKDTEGFSFADLKELFISAVVFDYKYDDCLRSLQNSLYTEQKKTDGDEATRNIKSMAKALHSLMGKK